MILTSNRVCHHLVYSKPHSLKHAGVDLWPKCVVLLSLCTWYSNVMNDLSPDVVKFSLGSWLRTHLARSVIRHNIPESPVPQGRLAGQMSAGGQRYPFPLRSLLPASRAMLARKLRQRAAANSKRQLWLCKKMSAHRDDRCCMGEE